VLGPDLGAPPSPTASSPGKTDSARFTTAPSEKLASQGPIRLAHSQKKRLRVSMAIRARVAEASMVSPETPPDAKHLR